MLCAGRVQPEGADADGQLSASCGTSGTAAAVAQSIISAIRFAQSRQTPGSLFSSGAICGELFSVTWFLFDPLRPSGGVLSVGSGWLPCARSGTNAKRKQAIWPRTKWKSRITMKNTLLAPYTFVLM